MLRICSKTTFSSVNTRGFTTKKAASKSAAEPKTAAPTSAPSKETTPSKEAVSTKDSSSPKEAAATQSQGKDASPAGPAKPSLLPKLFREKVKEFEHKDAFRHVPRKIRWTFIELDKNTSIFGHALVQNNMRPKTKLLLLLGNELEATTANLAAIKVGVIPTYAPRGLPSQDLDTVLKTVKPKTVLFHTKTTNVEEIDKLIPQYASSSFVKSVHYPWQYPFLKAFWHVNNKAQFNGLTPIREIYHIKTSTESHSVDDYDDDELAHPMSSGLAVGFSNISGMEEMSHDKLMTASESLAEKLHLNRNDRIGLVSEFSTPASQVAFWAGIHSGAVSVVPAETFDVEEILKALEVEKVSVVVGNAEQVDQLVSAGLRERVSTVQQVVTISRDLESKIQQ